MGNSYGNSINITVVDTISPTINSPSDVEFTDGETGNRIVWIMNDLRGAEYEVYVNGIVEYSGSWSGSLNLSLDTLSPGLYNYTCVQYDLGGNQVSDTVWVTVNAVAPTNTSATSTTATTDTETTTSTTTSSTTTTEEGDIPWMLIAIGGIGVSLVIVVVCIRKR